MGLEIWTQGSRVYHGFPDNILGNCHPHCYCHLATPAEWQIKSESISQNIFLAHTTEGQRTAKCSNTFPPIVPLWNHWNEEISESLGLCRLRHGAWFQFIAEPIDLRTVHLSFMKRASDLHSILEETTQIICQQPSYFCFPLHRDCISFDSSGIKMLLSNTAGGADGRAATVYQTG